MDPARPTFDCPTLSPTVWCQEGSQIFQGGSGPKPGGLGIFEARGGYPAPGLLECGPEQDGAFADFATKLVTAAVASASCRSCREKERTIARLTSEVKDAHLTIARLREELRRASALDVVAPPGLPCPDSPGLGPQETAVRTPVAPKSEGLTASPGTCSPPLGAERVAGSPAEAPEGAELAATKASAEAAAALPRLLARSPVGGAALAPDFSVDCRTPELVRCAERGELAGVLALLQRGEDPSSKDDLGFSALHGAAKKGHTAVVSALLERRADANLSSSKGETPVHYVCKYGHEETLKVLLQHGADPDIASQEGRTALQYARVKHQAGVERLLQQHAVG